MASKPITTASSVLILGAVLVVGGGQLATPAPADPVDNPVSETFPYLPLWPFASEAEAMSANTAWHRDPQETALHFARDYLGFAEIDRTTTVTEHVDEAWVGVGYASPNGDSHTAATIHLARFGTAPDAPWEVVGSLDDDLALTSPPYGSTAGSVIDAGGTITGVDESLHLQVHQGTGGEVLGEFCCVPAGGEAQPWSARVATSPPQPGALTVVVWTGGHVAEVERFAVTGLRA
ncbi:hypothetical protein [Mycobacterium sp. C31M]